MTSAPLRPCGPFCARHPLPEAGTRAPAAFSWAHNSLRNAQALCTPQRTAQNSAPAVVGPHPTVLPLRRFSGPTAAHLFIYSHHPLGIPLPHPCSCARACVRACAWLRGGPLLVLPRSTGAGHGRVPATGSMIGEGSGRIRLDGPLLRERWLFPSPGRMFIPCLMASVYSRSPGICSFHLLKLYIAVSSATCKSAVCSVAFALALPFTATLHRVQPSLYCIVAAP